MIRIGNAPSAVWMAMLAVMPLSAMGCAGAGAAAGAAAPVGDEAFAVLAEFLAYDVEPVHARVTDRVDTAGGMRERIVFDDWDGRDVPAFLSIPKDASAPLPVVILVDGLAGSKARWWQADGWPRGLALSRALVDAGFAVLALDAPYHGERIAEGGLEEPWAMRTRAARMREMITRAAVEQRRAIDYLATRPEIDTSRVGMLGLSMGGVVTHIVASVEPRVKVIVAGVTPLTWITPALHAGNFAPRIHQPTLLLMGRTDSYYTPAAAERHLSLVAAERKELELYDAGHRLPEEYVRRAVGFLVRELR